MNQIQMRCPSCEKLYRVESTKIFSSEPHFHCFDCGAHFTFDFPPADFAHIPTRLTSQKLEVLSEVQKEVKEIMLPTPSEIELKWQSVLAQYENLPLHQDFLQTCLSEKCLDHAHAIYSQILKAQGQDAIAEKMLRQISVLQNMRPQMHHFQTPQISREEVEGTQFYKTPYFILGALGFAMTLYALAVPQHRNVMGFGIALMLLGLGLKKMKQVNY